MAEEMETMNPSKVALVTGSGKRRVGWHVAAALAARGYALAVHYRSSAAEALSRRTGPERVTPSLRYRIVPFSESDNSSLCNVPWPS